MSGNRDLKREIHRSELALVFFFRRLGCDESMKDHTS